MRISSRSGLNVLIIVCLFAVEAALPYMTQIQAEALLSADWWNSDWKIRAEVKRSNVEKRLLRIPLPADIQPGEIRCVLQGEETPLDHWLQTIEMTVPDRIMASRKVPYRFPRMAEMANGEMLLSYCVGATHSSHHPRYSIVAARRSADHGRTWSPERVLWKEKEDYSAFNPVPLVVPGGRVIFWISKYQYSVNSHLRLPGL